MGVSFQGPNNAKAIRHIEEKTGVIFTNDEVFKGEENNHKFIVGQILELFGLEDYPQFNGEKVTISSFREDGPHGKAYYLTSNNPNLDGQLNWTYEYRLRNVG